MKKNGKSIQMALALLAVGTLLLNGCSAAKPAEKKSIRIGVTLYRGEDDFPAGKHGIFRCSQRRNQGGRHTVCAAFK